ncbi:MAG: N-acetylglucosamine-6-phosphate deacetylase [Clostridia bacterium]
MLIKNAKIFLEDQIIDSGFIKISDGKIQDYGTMSDLSYKTSYHFETDFINAEGSIVAPGFIDEHIHGVAGMDFMDEAKGIPVIEKIAVELLKEGTTAFLATTMTDSTENISSVCNSVYMAMNDLRPKPLGAKLLGVHMEGPFINTQYRGAQKAEHIVQPDAQAFRKVFEETNRVIKLVTYAVEKDPNCEFTKTLVELGVVAACGHSNASSNQVAKHVRAGLGSITHFHNAMSKFLSREPGVVVAGFAEQVFVELIVDGIHTHPSVVKATYRGKGADSIVLVTDSNRAKSLPDGSYDLGGQTIIKQGGECLTEDGHLGGSVIHMIDAVKNMVKFTGCSLHDAVNMASASPAKNLGIFHAFGSISKGKWANLLFLNESAEIELVLIEGQIALTKPS